MRTGLGTSLRLQLLFTGNLLYFIFKYGQVQISELVNNNTLIFIRKISSSSDRDNLLIYLLN